MRFAISVLATIALALFITAMNMGAWVSVASDEEVFVAGALESFEVDGSYEALGDLITDEVIERYPSAAVIEVQLRGLFTSFIATEPFEPALEELAGQVHRAVVLGEGNAVVIDLAAYEQVILDAVTVFSPALADQVPAEAFTAYTIFEAGSLRDLSGDVGRAVTFGWVGVVAVVVLVALIFLIGSTLAYGMTLIGIALAAGGLLSMVALGIGRGRADLGGGDPRQLTLSHNLYDTLAASVERRSWLIALAGLIVLGVAFLLSKVAAGRNG